MPVFVQLLSYIERHVIILDDLNAMKNALSTSHQVLSKYYLFTYDSYFYMVHVILDLRFKKTYLEHTDFESLYLGLINATVTMLKS